MNKGGVALAVTLGVGLMLARSGAKVRAPRKATADEKAAVLDVWQRHGWPTHEADKAIQIESSWIAKRVNKSSHAVGLIQFLPSTLESVDWYRGWQAFADLSANEQIPYIDKYLSHVGKQWLIPGDTYLVLVAPAFIGVPDDTIIYPAGTPEATGNPALQAPDGNVTAGSVRALVR